ncbi:nucleoside recognition domain-containing protein [Paenibacillus chungangensis]|uniref:Nucleoside recognition domain-containing protein n=1 Tax=Paenibacillus chungangensis TaxID=696535 RepID=A0ABW3HPG7_9BACL
MPKTILVAVLSVALVCSIILQPDASFQASLQGLAVWWNIIFPGLLPFLVLYEIMLAFGLVHALGALLAPLMTRLFRLPGEAGLVLMIGLLGGYTAGTAAAADLRKRQLISSSQAERLQAYSHMPNPLFMLVIVGAGFLHRPLTGVIIAAAVWLSALWLLLATSLLSGKAGRIMLQSNDRASGRLIGSAAAAMQAAREKDGRSFGTALGEAVSSGVQKLLMIGGFILCAAVFARMCEPLLSPFLTTAPFLGPALFESHLGAYAAAEWQQHASSTAVASAIAATLAWSGLGGILQAVHSASGTDMRLLPFIAHRIAHALHAALFVFLLWKPITILAHYLSGSIAQTTSAHQPGLNVVLSPFPYSTSDLPPIWDKSLITAGVCLAACLIAVVILKQRRWAR